jgi:hypothetical protein
MHRSMLHDHGCNVTCTCNIATRINQQAFLKWSARESNDILDVIQFNVCGHMKIPSQGGGWLLILFTLSLTIFQNTTMFSILKTK